MSRAPEGALVNLLPDELPADVYGIVADRVLDRIYDERVQNDSDAFGFSLKINFDRSLVKKAVMTYFYHCGEHEMARQIKKTLFEKGDQAYKGAAKHGLFLVKHIRA